MSSIFYVGEADRTTSFFISFDKPLASISGETPNLATMGAADFARNATFTPASREKCHRRDIVFLFQCVER